METYRPNFEESYLLSVEVDGKTLFLTYSVEFDPWTTSPSHGNDPTFEIEKINFDLVEQPSKDIKPSKNLAGFVETLNEDRARKNVFKSLLEKYKVNIEDFKVQKIFADKVIFIDVDLKLLGLI